MGVLEVVAVAMWAMSGVSTTPCSFPALRESLWQVVGLLSFGGKAASAARCLVLPKLIIRGKTNTGF